MQIVNIETGLDTETDTCLGDEADRKRDNRDKDSFKIFHNEKSVFIRGKHKSDATA